MNAVYVMPRSRFGVWSLMLGVGFVLMETVFIMLVAAGQRGGATFWSNPLLLLPTVAAAACGLAAGLGALAALTFRRDRAVVLVLPLLLGLFVLVFTIGELGGH
jgi:hypothetical protein